MDQILSNFDRIGSSILKGIGLRPLLIIGILPAQSLRFALLDHGLCPWTRSIRRSVSIKIANAHFIEHLLYLINHLYVSMAEFICVTNKSPEVTDEGKVPAVPTTNVAF